MLEPAEYILLPGHGNLPLVGQAAASAGQIIFGYKLSSLELFHNRDVMTPFDLHDRAGFEDHDEPNRWRLLYPARFLDPATAERRGSRMAD